MTLDEELALHEAATKVLNSLSKLPKTYSELGIAYRLIPDDLHADLKLLIEHGKAALDEKSEEAA